MNPPASAAGIDAPPTPAPPAPAAVFAAPEPASAPVAEPDPVPIVVVRTDCAAISGTAYESAEERDWFVANCRQPAQASRAPAAVVPAAPAANAPVAPAPQQPASATEEELRYRSKASAQLGYFNARIKQFVDADYSPGFDASVLEAASISDGFVNALDGLQPAPPRFKSVHDSLRRSMTAFRDYLRTGITLTTSAEFKRWIPGLRTAADRADSALATYNQVVGTKLPGLR